MVGSIGQRDTGLHHRRLYRRARRPRAMPPPLQRRPLQRRRVRVNPQAAEAGTGAQAGQGREARIEPPRWLVRAGPEVDPAAPGAREHHHRGRPHGTPSQAAPVAGRTLPREPGHVGRAGPGRDARTGGGVMTTRIYIAGPITGHPDHKAAIPPQGRSSRTPPSVPSPKSSPNSAKAPNPAEPHHAKYQRSP